MQINDGYKIGQTVYLINNNIVYQRKIVSITVTEDSFSYIHENNDGSSRMESDGRHLFSTNYCACMTLAKKYQARADAWKLEAIK